MSITELRKVIEEIRMHAQDGNVDEVIRAADDALHTLDNDQLLTTTQAAELLGIRSVNTLKLLVRGSGIGYEMRGNRMMIPLTELQRLQESPQVRGIRTSDRLHDASADLGTEEGLNEEGLNNEQLEDLVLSRPGRLPWKTYDGRTE